MNHKEFLFFLNSFAKGDVINNIHYFDAKSIQTRIIIDCLDLHIDRSQIIFVLNSLNDPDPDVMLGSIRYIAYLCTLLLRQYMAEPSVYKTV